MGGGSGLGMAGPLAVFASGFSAELLVRGYRPRSAGEQLRLMADASEWLAGRGLGAGDLPDVRVAELMAGRRAAGRSHLLSSQAIVPLLDYLRGLGVVPVAVARTSVTPSEVPIERYSVYLRDQRGVSSSTVRNYVGIARVFLSWRETSTGTLALGELDGAAVIAFVLGEAQRQRWFGEVRGHAAARVRALLACGGRDLSGARGRGAVGRELAVGGIGQGVGRRIARAVAGEL